MELFLFHAVDFRERAPPVSKHSNRISFIRFALGLTYPKEFGSGSICCRKGNAYTYTIADGKGLIQMVSLLSGKMKTPKIAALYRLIDWVNEKECMREKKIKRKFPNCPENSEPLTQNAWLSGFIEAEGHFFIRTTGVKNTVGKLTELQPTQTKVECKFELVQAQNTQIRQSHAEAPPFPARDGSIDSGNQKAYPHTVESGNRTIMLEIADCFQCEVKEIRTSTKSPPI